MAVKLMNVAYSKLKIWSVIGLAVAAAVVVTLPIWGMGAAIFIDSERTVLTHVLSPDRTQVAQVERLVVGGAPSIIVTVKQTWMPNWYLLGCVAVSHYGDTSARVRWQSNRSLTIATLAEASFWRAAGAPFHRTGCSDLSTSIKQIS